MKKDTIRGIGYFSLGLGLAVLIGAAISNTNAYAAIPFALAGIALVLIGKK